MQDFDFCPNLIKFYPNFAEIGLNFAQIYLKKFAR